MLVAAAFLSIIILPYAGTWKADSLLRQWVDWPGAPNATTPFNPDQLKYYPLRLQQQQAGVEETRNRLSATYQGVQVSGLALFGLCLEAS